MLRIPVRDCTAGYRCYRRKVLESIDLDTIQSQGYAFQVELAYRVMRQGFKIVEIPIIFMDRRVGKSKMSRTIFLEGLTWVIRTRFSRSSGKGKSIPSSSPNAAFVSESDSSNPELVESPSMK